MPKIRSIKPEFFTSETVSTLSLRTRLTWIGLWTQCDDHGRSRDNARLIKAAVWPLDPVSLAEIEEDLHHLATANLIDRYQSNGKSLLAVTNWSEHQHPNRVAKPQFPGPSDPGSEPRTIPVDGNTTDTARQAVDNPATGHLPSSEQQCSDTAATVRQHANDRLGGYRKGEEGNARATAAQRPPADSLPAPRCPIHEHDPDPPSCGRCADARRARQTAERDRARQLASVQQQRGIDRATATAAEVAACGMCDANGYLTAASGVKALCSHDPGLAERVKRRAAEMRAQIANKERRSA